MINPLQSLIVFQLELLRTSLMMTQQMLEAYVTVQKQVQAAAQTGASPAPSGIQELTRFLAVKPNGCIGPADLTS